MRPRCWRLDRSRWTGWHGPCGHTVCVTCIKMPSMRLPLPHQDANPAHVGRGGLKGTPTTADQQVRGSNPQGGTRKRHRATRERAKAVGKKLAAFGAFDLRFDPEAVAEGAATPRRCVGAGGTFRPFGECRQRLAGGAGTLRQTGIGAPRRGIVGRPLGDGRAPLAATPGSCRPCGASVRMGNPHDVPERIIGRRGAVPFGDPFSWYTDGDILTVAAPSCARARQPSPPRSQQNSS